MSKSAINELEREMKRIEKENPILIFDEKNTNPNKKKTNFKSLRAIAKSLKDEVIDYV